MRWLLALAALIASPAAAHRGHASLSVVLVDAKSGAVTVSHRLDAHDVEPALVTIAPDAQPSLDDPDAVAALIAHVGRRFVIAGVPLAYRSQQIAGDQIVLVYAGRIAPRTAALTISADLLGDSHDDAEAQVNIRRAGITRSLVFRPGDAAKAVPLK